MKRLTDPIHGEGAFGFRLFGHDGRQLPLWKETPIGKWLRERLDKMHAGEVIRSVIVF